MLTAKAIGVIVLNVIALISLGIVGFNWPPDGRGDDR